MIGSTIYKTIQRISVKLGFNLAVSKIRDVNNAGFEHIYPSANYAPWLSDNEFKETYEIIKTNTLVHEYKCYELWELVKEVKHLEGSFIEVGVWRGGSAALIAKQMELNGIKDKLYLCDTFEGVVKVGDKDTFYKDGQHSDASQEDVVNLLDKLNIGNNIKILSGIFPDETKDFVFDKKFKFIHIDVDVYKSAKDSVEWLWDKLVVGGIIVFDDYGHEGCNGITTFVNEERNKEDRLVIYNLNGHGIIVKIR